MIGDERVLIDTIRKETKNGSDVGLEEFCW